MTPQGRDQQLRHDPQRTLIVLQATPFCNLDCTYCYLPQRSDKRRMAIETLEKIFEQVLYSNLLEDPISIVWHAGEPLAVPVGYFREAFALFEEINSNAKRKCALSLQTNATLINDAWIELFQDYGVVVGVSVDGPGFIHDKKRLDRSGRGTHSRVMKGISALRDSGVPMSVIMVLTDAALDHPDEVFDFFLSESILDVGFNIDEIEGINEASSYTDSKNVERYRRFMRRLLELVKSHGDKVRVREFRETLRSLALINPGAESSVSCSMNEPLRILNFAWNGDYSTFCPELLGTRSERYSDFQMGNVLRDPVDSIQKNSVFQIVNREVRKGVSLCQESCEYWAFCGGGAPANKFFEHGRFDVTETMYCRVHKKTLVDEVLRFVEEDLELDGG